MHFIYSDDRNIVPGYMPDPFLFQYGCLYYKSKCLDKKCLSLIIDIDTVVYKILDLNQLTFLNNRLLINLDTFLLFSHLHETNICIQLNIRLFY